MPVYPTPLFRSIQRPTADIISPASWESIGTHILQLSASSASATYPTTNLALFVPFRLSEPRKALQMWTCNGATAAANLDVGVYDAVGNRLVSIGTTAQAGTSALQLYDITDTWFDSDVTYYMAIAANNTTPTLFRWTGVNAGQIASFGILQMATAFVLPATATYAACTTNYIPLFGISFVATF
jgi:hypothetical protein